MTRTLAFSLGLAVMAVSLSGCFGDNGGTTVPVPAGSGTAQPTDFSAFAYKVYEEPANSPPVNFDTTVFAYDADNDPAAFAGLFM